MPSNLAVLQKKKEKEDNQSLSEGKCVLKYGYRVREGGSTG